ncbi:MAG: hypothetical protein CSA66_06310 [Proteobacteria bacterium]|nr:MAG: hypothetical protein CSA66_06310 [Pseudomonadota bacterium]
MALTPTIRALVGASALLLGCGGELAPAPASADGASPSDEATTARPADVAAHAVAIDALLGDLAPPVAPERLRGAPIQRLALRVDGAATRIFCACP